MEIKKIIENNTLKIFLEGRLDTNTVPELENELPSLDTIEKIIFDFEKIEYISSSGLRLILKCKKSVDSTKVINCSSEVYDIFNMTGFTEMMNVEKTMRKISIDNCEKIGEGFFGIIYRIDPETIVKVYKIPDSLDKIKNEISLAKKAFVMGIPTAIPYDIVRVENLYGAVFELLNAKSSVSLINSDTDLDSFTKKSSEVLKLMHNRVDEKGELPDRKKLVLNKLEECKDVLLPETANKIHHLLETIPDQKTVLHCDFQIKNIMMQNNELLLIDMDTLSVGHPIFEFASMYAAYYGFSCVNKYNTDRFLGIPLDVSTKIFNKTFEYYYSDKTKEELEDIKLKLSIISYLKILYLRLKFKDKECTTEKEDIEFCINYLNENSKRLDTLNY